MAEINAKDLTAKTSPASTDSMLLFGTTSNEGAKITVDNLADNILGRLATKTFPNQVGGSSAATILAQLATLNSNKASSDRIVYIEGSKDILASIENVSMSSLIFGTASGNSYEGRSPNGQNTYKYGSFICMRRGPNAISLFWFPETVAADRPIYYLTHTNGGWTNCYPLTYGSTIQLV